MTAGELTLFGHIDLSRLCRQGHLNTSLHIQNCLEAVGNERKESNENNFLKIHMSLHDVTLKALHSFILLHYLWIAMNS